MQCFYLSVDSILFFMNQNNKLNLLKLSIIRRVLESRSKSNNSNNKTMAWRATGENNDTFVDELKGKTFFYINLQLLDVLIKICIFRIWSY